MNERIRELWAKCVIKHTNDPMNWQTVADEFAQLIVIECASIAARNPDIRGWTLAKLFKDQFGVDK